MKDGARVWGYVNSSGSFVIAPQFDAAEEFEADGLAVVQREGATALIDQNGQLVTSFGDGYISPSDDGVRIRYADGGVQLLDASGTTVFTADSRTVGDLIRAEVDGTLSYLTREGEVVWQAPDRWTLPGGVVVADRKHREGREVLIHYPELSGLPDPEVQRRINERLKSLFLEQPASDSGWAEGVPRTLEVGFSVEQVGRVLVVERSGYDYPLGAAHGMPSRDHYHFDLDTGAEYRLADLFRAGSPYPERLRELVRRQIEEDPNSGGWDRNPEVRPDQPFAAGPDGLEVYWAPYEIAPYAAGFPAFRVPYADLQELIDTGGAFWRALQAGERAIS